MGIDYVVASYPDMIPVSIPDFEAYLKFYFSEDEINIINLFYPMNIHYDTDDNYILPGNINNIIIYMKDYLKGEPYARDYLGEIPIPILQKIITYFEIIKKYNLGIFVF